MGEVSTGVTIIGRRNASAPTSRRSGGAGGLLASGFAPVASRSSPGSDHEVVTSVCLEKQQHGCERSPTPGEGNFAPRTEGKGSRKWGDLRVRSTVIGPRFGGDEVKSNGVALLPVFNLTTRWARVVRSRSCSTTPAPSW